MSAVQVLESLLTRVQQRAAEPRPGAVAELIPVLEPLAPMEPAQPTAATTLPFSSSPVALDPRDRKITRQMQRVRVEPTAAKDEAVEEYDEELIEILDDSDIDSSSGTSSSRLERSAVELSPELVARRSGPPAAVAQVIGQRPSLTTTDFVTLLDISLKLGQ